MRLIKIEKPDAIWYFTTQLKAAEFIGCSQMHINNILHGVGKTAKGWTIKEVDEDNVFSRFINPEPNIYTAEELVLTKQMFELLRQVIENDKRIEDLENRIEVLKKNIEKANVQK